MDHEPAHKRVLPTHRSALPRIAWMVGGVLCLAFAALAGALVMKSMGSTTQAVAPSTSASAATAPEPNRLAAMSQPVPRADTPPAAHPVVESPRAVKAADPQQHRVPTTRTSPVASCRSCGTVESVDVVQVKGQGTGVGAVAGGVLGGVVGHQIGGGNGKTAMAVLGAIGGGFAGNEVERRVRSESSFDVRVRMEDGSSRVVRQSHSVAVGTRVVVEGNRLRVAARRSADDAAVMHTSGPAAHGG